MKFDGSSGRRPSAEARRYIYAILVAMISNDMEDPDGWIRGGIDCEFDTRRLKNEAKKVAREMRRKADR